MRHLEQDLTVIEIDRREDPIRRFDNGYPFDIQAATALVGRRASSRVASGRMRSGRCG